MAFLSGLQHAFEISIAVHILDAAATIALIAGLEWISHRPARAAHLWWWAIPILQLVMPGYLLPAMTFREVRFYHFVFNGGFALYGLGKTFNQLQGLPEKPPNFFEALAVALTWTVLAYMLKPNY